MNIRIALVHHDSPTREELKRIVASQAECSMVWSAAGGDEAVRSCRKNAPDLLLLDLALPFIKRRGEAIGSLLLIGEIMKACPCAILLLTDSVENNAARVFEAMGQGALDAVRVYRDATGRMQGAAELVKKINVIRRLLGKADHHSATTETAIAPIRDRLVPLIAIGASTGGPKALSVILKALPADIEAAIVIVQHMDEQFSPGLSRWLNQQCPLQVDIAREGGRPVASTALIASTNDHIVFGEDLALHYIAEPRSYPYRPSVDVFFESLRKNWPRPDMAVLLTGMGRDGGVGMAALRKAGWHTIAQDEKTSVVYGMPAAAIGLGGVDEILPLKDIAQAIMSRLKKK